MIIHKNTKSVETNSLSPNENFGNYENVFVVDDASELGQKILSSQPFFELELSGNGSLIDITPTERLPEPSRPPSELDILKDVQSQVVLALVMGGLM